MYHTLFTNENCVFRLICFFAFTVDNGGSQKTEIIGNLTNSFSQTQCTIINKKFAAIIYIINVAKTKIDRSFR